MQFAVKLTPRTLDYVVGFGDALLLDLRYLRTSLEDAMEMGEELYVISEGSIIEGGDITFTVMTKGEFFHIWKFVNEKEDRFTQVKPS